MRHGMDGVFVGSGIFKSENPVTTAEASGMMAGKPMEGLEIETLDVRMDQRGW